MIPAGAGLTRENMIAPLRREKLVNAEGKRIGKRTQRAVTQSDITKARAAASEAVETKQGRAIMAQLGSMGK